MATNKNDLVDAVLALSAEQEINVGKGDTVKLVNNVLDSIITLTGETEKLQLVGFGSFEVRTRAARKGRNPQSGEEIQIAESKGIGFKPGKQFKESVK